MRSRLLLAGLPVLVGILVLAAWEALVRVEGIPPYILPGPLAIAAKLVADWGTLSGSCSSRWR